MIGLCSQIEVIVVNHLTTIFNNEHSFLDLFVRLQTPPFFPCFDDLQVVDATVLEASIRAEVSRRTVLIALDHQQSEIQFDWNLKINLK